MIQGFRYVSSEPQFISTWRSVGIPGWYKSKLMYSYNRAVSCSRL
jgi:hypothetical protein